MNYSNQIKGGDGMGEKEVWTERIINISDFEKLVRDAKMVTGFLNNSIKNNDEEKTALYLTSMQKITQEMLDFEFIIEKRKVTLRS